MVNGKMDHKETRRQAVIKITLKGCLDERWLNRFKGFTLQHSSAHHSILVGEVASHDALYETIDKIRDIGIPLLSIERLECGPCGCKDTER